MRGQSLPDRILDRLEECIIASLIAAATIVTFVAVLHRYGASNSAVLARWAGVRLFINYHITAIMALLMFSECWYLWNIADTQRSALSKEALRLPAINNRDRLCD